jgi:Uma2 family endonuclease
MSIAEHSHETIPSAAVLPPAAPPSAIPPLCNGDHLTRVEFERRYAAMPHIKKAELIEGIVYMPSPVRLPQHGQPHANVITWLNYYRSKTPHLLIGDNSTSRLEEDNEPQPDVLLLLPSWAGSSAKLEDGYVSGAPDLVCEVAASSVSIDLHGKKNAYRRNGVKEYIAWRIEDRQVDWFALVEGRYELLPADEQGRISSKVFSGLWLDVAALLAGDLPKLFAAVDEGVASPEHQAFVETLTTTAPR